MLFNSYVFLFLFLPITLIFYFYLLKQKLVLGSKIFLVIASLFFYGYWNINYIFLLLLSIFVNYGVGLTLINDTKIKISRKAVLLFGILFNIGLLGYFKYTDFFIENFNWIFSTNFSLLHLVLPLAISYFTFQQIAFLIDSYRYETKEYEFLDYLVFITFFPQLLMGPIMYHKEIFPQFKNVWNFKIKWENIALGLFIFSIGLAKKTLLGDPLTDYAQNAFNHAQDLSMIEAWYASISYVLSYYFDLSGYADMAIGIGKMFNINIPINFNSPYKARNFADYWQRWHITLSRFLSDYVYKILGGSRRGTKLMYLNIMITFFISGFWHGAGWTFVVWGIINGIFVVIAHMMKKLNIKMNYFIAWGLMFLGLIVTRILFVSSSFSDAWYVTYTLFDISNLRFTDLPYADKWFQTTYIFIGLILVLFFKNSTEISNNFKPNKKYLIYTILLLSASLFTFTKAKAFLYFQF